MSFADLASALAELEGIPSRIAREVADGINEELASQFDRGTDPYGKPWAPLRPETVRRKSGDARILRRADELSASTEARPSAGAGIEITSIEYGQFHQSGTKHMPRRAVLPDEGELPPAWLDIIDAATEKAFAKVLR